MLKRNGRQWLGLTSIQNIFFLSLSKLLDMKHEDDLSHILNKN